MPSRSRRVLSRLLLMVDGYVDLDEALRERLDG
jgi:hypothetical protein